MKFTLPLLALSGIALAATTPPPLADDRPLCEIADEWAQNNVGNLPTTLDGILSYDRTYQRAIFNNSPRSTQVGFWREHLGRFVETHNELTLDQASFLTGLSENLEVYFDAGDDRTSVEALEADARELLGDKLAAAAIANLGESNQLSVAAAPGGCSCSVGSDWCTGINTDCLAGGCDRTSSGCGTLWLFNCDGNCKLNPT